MISSIITPVRWYNDFYEANRYATDCDVCPFELISDKTRLLPFQFRRPASGYFLSSWYLRKACVEPMVSLQNDNDRLFTFDTGYWSYAHYVFENGKIKTTNINSQIDKLFIFQDAEYYSVKIVVSEINYSAPFTITAQSNARVIANITSVGTYYFEFLADATDEDFSILSVFTSGSDYLVIDEIKISKRESFSTSLGDIEFPIDLLSYTNTGSTDVIQYIGNPFEFQIPCGKYYMIIKDEAGNYYYSELITVKDFIPSQSPYTMIEWKNNCDLSDVIFQSIDDENNYFNRLYIDGQLTRPEYPFKEEGDEDGNNTLNITFQKWEKKQSLIVTNAPEFIVDALTAIRLHDTVTITKSLRKNQLQVLNAFEVEKVESEIQSIFNDCATNVELKLLLKEKIVDATCCTNISLNNGCVVCNYTVDEFDTLTNGYYFGQPTDNDDFGLYQVVLGNTNTSNFLNLSEKYKFLGNLTSIYSSGSFIYVSNTGNTDGFQFITSISYDALKNTTIIEWNGINNTDGLATIQLASINFINNSNEVVCVSASGKSYYNVNGDFWAQIPSIYTVTDLLLDGGHHVYTLSGFNLPNTFIRIGIVIFDGVSSPQSIIVPTIYTSAELNNGIVLNSQVLGFIPPSSGTVTFSIESFSLKCNNGVSENFIITY